jgi:hypothetical protein
MDFLDSRKSQHPIVSIGSPVKSGARELHDERLLEELGWFTQLLLIDDDFHPIPEMSKRNTTEIAMLIEMTENALRDAMPICLGHDSKDWPHVEMSHLGFIFEAVGVKGGLRRFF